LFRNSLSLLSMFSLLIGHVSLVIGGISITNS
jgi:hypothetical protein